MLIDIVLSYLEACPDKNTVEKATKHLYAIGVTSNVQLYM